MRLGEILVARGLVSRAEIEAALQRQLVEGGRLGDNLIALGILTSDLLAAVVNSAPSVPASLAETGLSSRTALNLLLKFMHAEACETVTGLADRLRLPRLMTQLMEHAVQQRFVEAKGAAGGLALSIRYSLSELGRKAAKEDFEQNLYLGPAPVCLAAYQEQIERQRVSNEMLDADALRGGFEGLVVPEHYVRKLLPAINAGRSVLIFGPPGNGKTTLATRIAKLFKDTVYIPYAVEVGGQIIKVFDHTMHRPIAGAENSAAHSGLGLHREPFDQRWVACSRPVAIAGGELTLEMLDLQFGTETKFYDAPLHVKAFNGLLLIDDFGRQKFRPDDLLNRWIVPMENQLD